MAYLLLVAVAIALFITAYKAIKNDINRKTAIKVGVILIIFAGLIYYVLFS
ncbi:MAG: hypothetical protein IKN74_02170 [Clostridia bacterium]|nr:hypothetical protein [Clostridia bacterium]